MEPDPLHVLVMTDDPQLPERVDSLLREAGPPGSSARAVATSADAEEKLDGRSPTAAGNLVVLLDLAAPGLGFEAVERVSDELAAPVVALAEPDGAGRGEEAVAHGAQEYLVRGETGPDGLVRSLRHARERQALRNQVQEKASLLESTLMATEAGVLVTDLDGDVVLADDRFREMWGIPDEVVEEAEDDYALMDHVRSKLEDPEAWIEGIEELYDAPEAERYDVLEFTDGRVFERFSRPQRRGGEVVGRVWSFRDVTERERAEEALRDSEERFRSLYENATIGLYRATPEGEIVLANPAMVEMLGYDSFEDLVEAAHEEGRYHPTYSREAWKARIEEEGRIRGLEATWERADGDAIRVRESAGAVRDEDGEVRYYEGTVEDVTERWRAERQLERRNRLLEGLHDVSLRILEHVDVDDVLEEIADQAADLMGTEHGWIFRRDEDRDVLRLAHTTPPLDDQRGHELRRGEGHAGTIWEGGEPLLVEDYDTWDGRTPGFPEGVLETVAGVPLTTGGETRGVLGVSVPRPGGFQEEELATLQRLAALASVALENARLVSTMEAEIRERRETEDALRRSEERYRALVEAAPDAIYTVALDGTIESVNPAFEDITGWDPEEWEGRNVEELLHPDDVARAREKIADVAEGKDPVEAEIRFRTRDRGHVLAHLVGSPRVVDGEIEGLVGIGRDVTERKERERRLAESERRLRRAQDVADIGHWTWDVDEDRVEWSDQLHQLYGVPPGGEPLTYEAVLDLVHPEDRERVDAAVREALESGEGYDLDHRIVRPDGEVRWMHTRAEVETDEGGNVTQLGGTSQDITNFKESQQILAERTRRLETLISNLPGIVYRCRNEPGWPMEQVEGECEDLIGYPASALVDGDVDYGGDVIHPDDREHVWAEVQDAVGSGEPFEIVYRVVTRDGSTRWVWERGRGITPSHGDSAVLEGFITDITERKQAQERLRTVKNFNETLLEHAPVAIAHIAEDGIVTYQNRELRRIRAVPPGSADPLEEVPVDEFGPVARRPELAHRIEALLDDGEPFTEYQSAFEDAHGQEVHLAITGVPLEAEGGDVDGAILLARDVTDERELEREVERQTVQLIQREKMAALGQLVAGVAHEINNPLSVLKSNTELLLESADRVLASDWVQALARGEAVDGEALAEEVAEHGDEAWLYEEGLEVLETNLKSLERIADFIDSLRTFASRDPDRGPTDLNAVLEDTVELFLAQYREEVDLRTSWAELPPVPCDGSQVGQVVMNLLVNAAEASPPGGPVRLRTRRGDGEAVIEVDDGGEGVPAGEQEAIFDPFYSTKEDDSMGLGLSISQNLIRDHGGAIDVESEPGEGALFRVRLPTGEGAG